MAVSNYTCPVRVSLRLLRKLMITHTKCLSPDLPALIAHFIPGTTMHLVRTITQLSRQAYDFANHEFGNASGVCKRRVEDSNAMPCSIVEVDLICTDTEAAHNNKVLCLPQYLLCKFSLRSYPKDMHISVFQIINSASIMGS
jgi:hypothetical protein